MDADRYPLFADTKEFYTTSVASKVMGDIEEARNLQKKLDRLRESIAQTMRDEGWVEFSGARLEPSDHVVDADIRKLKEILPARIWNRLCPRSVDARKFRSVAKKYPDIHDNVTIQRKFNLLLGD